ncbi:MAG: hypothetical protein EZS28_012347 [Streblomastix strix]|uniref:Uncharacterized protein n=1 Tax=Streblomastix strix TaxID=222440 RepID=A0A5J4WB30_9EUKA|nr:MAG: hypothetical protein EZS28_012347 [Streblomastix strix]
MLQKTAWIIYQWITQNLLSITCETAKMVHALKFSGVYQVMELNFRLTTQQRRKKLTKLQEKRIAKTLPHRLIRNDPNDIQLFYLFLSSTRGVIFSFAFTLISFLVFISSVIIVVTPLIGLFITKREKERLWAKLDVWLAEKADEFKDAGVIIYHTNQVFKTISKQLPSRYVIPEKCQTVHIVNIERK